METPPIFLIGSALILGYCLPSIVAFVRQHSATPWICVLNLCFGWTILGWLAALFWSSTTHHRHRFRLKTATHPSAGHRITKPARSITYAANSKNYIAAAPLKGAAHSGV